jgi:hypothetical protein
MIRLLIFAFFWVCSSQPAPWLPAIASQDALYGGDETNGAELVLPATGNGYLGWQVGAELMYVAGVYSGAATSPSHRAGVPCPSRLRVAGGRVAHSQLHVREGYYARRSEVRVACGGGGGGGSEDGAVRSCVEPFAAAGGVLHVEQRWYAHRVLRHVLVHEVEVLGDDAAAAPPRPQPRHAGPPPAATAPWVEGAAEEAPPVEPCGAGRGGARVLRAGEGGPALRVAPLRCYAVPAARDGTWFGGGGGSGGGGGVRGGGRVASTQGRGGSGGALGALALEADGGGGGEGAPDVEQRVLGADDCAAAAAWAASAAARAGEARAYRGILDEYGGGRRPEGKWGEVAARLPGGEADAEEGGGLGGALLRGCGGAWEAVVATTRAPELPGGEPTVVLTLQPRAPSARGATLPLTRAAVGATLPLLTVVVTSLDVPPLGEGEELLHALLAEGAARFEEARALAGAGLLFALHATAWREGVWSSGVEVGGVGAGGAHLGALTNSSLYALASTLRADWPFGLGPGGLSSGGYGGRSFWDTESFSWQTLNLLFPELGASLLEYRLHRLPGARRKARSYAPPYGAPGAAAAMVPWESAFTGVEACPEWAPTGAKEIHVSGDVAIAVAQHDALRGDDAWARRVAWPLLRGVAEFWVRRALEDTPGAVLAGGATAEARATTAAVAPDCAAAPRNCSLHVRGVIAPTEFYTCDDSTFTNGVAAEALRVATRFAGALGAHAGRGVPGAGGKPRPLRGLPGGGAPPVHAAAQPAAWADAAARLHIPFNASAGAHPYFEGYVWGGPVQLLDVPLLALTLGYPMRRAALAANIRTYLAAFEGGAAFSYAVNALAAAEVGEWRAAARWVGKGIDAFVAGPYAVWSEYPHGRGCPNFVTGAAGWLQALAFGFVRARVHTAGAGAPALTLRPALPPGVASIVLRGVALRGHRATVAVDAHGVTVALSAPSSGGACAPATPLRGGEGGAAPMREGDEGWASAQCPVGTEAWETALGDAAEGVLEALRRSAGAGRAWWPPWGRGGGGGGGGCEAGAAAARTARALAAGADARRAITELFPLPEWDPDDPFSEPEGMAGARPWLRPRSLAGALRYPQPPTRAPPTCLRVAVEGGGEVAVLGGADGVREVVVPAPRGGLQAPRHVDELPTLRLTVGGCGPPREKKK